MNAASPALLRRAGPRIITDPRKQLGGNELYQLAAAAAWTDADWASLLVNGSLLTADALSVPRIPPPDHLTLTPPPLLASVVSPVEPLVLSLDLWAFQAALSGGAGLKAVARGVARAGGWVMPRPYGTLAAAAAAGQLTPPAPGFAVTIVPSGYDVSANVTWSLSGIPAWGVWGNCSDGAPELSSAPSSNAARYGHNLTMNSMGGVLSIAPGTLRAGYVYALRADIEINATWTWTLDLPSWTGADADGGVRLSRLERRLRASAAARTDGNSGDRSLQADCLGCNFMPGETTAAYGVTARTPLLFVHSPPLASAPALAAPVGNATGRALVDPFSLTSTGWFAPDERALERDAPSPSLRRIYVSSLLSLPPSIARACASDSDGRGACTAALAQPAACIFDTASPPPWARALSLVSAALGSSASVFAVCNATVAASAAVESGRVLTAGAHFIHVRDTRERECSRAASSHELWCRCACALGGFA